MNNKIIIEEKDIESDRYTLYLNNGCPHANKCSIVLKLKGLEDIIDIIYSHFKFNKDHLFEFNGKDGTDFDKNNGFKLIKDLYIQSNYPPTSKYSIPILWDKKEKRIISNESNDIITILNSQFNKFSKNPSLNLRPINLSSQIDEFIDYYSKNLIFKIHQAFIPEKYSEVFDIVFLTIDKLNNFLENKIYLFGNEITEADIKIFVILIRFDVVISPIFKLNFKQLKEYPNILKYIKRLYQHPSIKPTINFDHIKGMSYSNTDFINNEDALNNNIIIIPKGPSIDYLNEEI